MASRFDTYIAASLQMYSFSERTNESKVGTPDMMAMARSTCRLGLGICSYGSSG